jgi:hypothetical protein
LRGNLKYLRDLPNIKVRKMQSCIVIHPSLAIRQLFKEILEKFGFSVNLESTLDGGLEKIRLSQSFALGCVSTRFDKRALFTWLSTLKANIKGRFIVYGAITTSQDRNQPYLLKEFDLDLSETLTEQAFRSYLPEVNKLLAIKRDERHKFMLAEILEKAPEAVNLACERYIKGYDFKSLSSWKNLQLIHKILENSASDVKAFYLEKLFEVFKKFASVKHKSEQLHSQQVKFLVKTVK